MSGPSICVACLCALGAPAGVPCTPLAMSLTAAGYDRLGTQRGVTIYRYVGEKYVRLAAEGHLRAPPRVVLGALLDYPAHAGRIKGVAQSRVLERGADWVLVYQRLELPLIDDRDFTLEVRFGEEEGRRWLTFDTANARGPPATKGVVRIEAHRGSWQLRPFGPGTFARYEMLIDLAGWIPHWAGQSQAGEELPRLFSTIAALASAAERKRP